MTKTFLWLTAFIACASSVAYAQDIGGTYGVSGTNFDGSSYSGTATVEMTARHTCRINWRTGESVSQGFCMVHDGTMAASYSFSSGEVGIVIYDVLGDGTLDGTWTLANSNGLGTEVLRPQ